jgi:hypothetical protein
MRIGAVLISGLLAGLWINLSGLILVGGVLGAEYVQGLGAHLPEPPGPATFLRHLCLRFGLGIVCVALYALLRPRFATLSGGALAAAAFLFLAAYLPLAAMLNEIGVLTGWRLPVTLAWGVGEAWVAALLGALLYDRLGA